MKSKSKIPKFYQVSNYYRMKLKSPRRFYRQKQKLEIILVVLTVGLIAGLAIDAFIVEIPGANQIVV